MNLDSHNVTGSPFPVTSYTITCLLIDVKLKRHCPVFAGQWRFMTHVRSFRSHRVYDYNLSTVITQVSL